MSEISIGQLINCAFNLARGRQQVALDGWRKISWGLGARLPGSMLILSLQRAGSLDAVLRSMEDEFDHEAEKTRPIEQSTADCQIMLSEIWVGVVYEILRLVNERALLPSSQERDALAYDFRLLRITLEKHEIAGDRKLRDPIEMRAVPAREGSSTYQYDRKDSLRAHIMPGSISQRGSVMWFATDLAMNASRWIERRQLSEKAIQLLL